MMIEDFSLADYEQSAAQTVLWLCVTFVGFVVMMNTLIAGEQRFSPRDVIARTNLVSPTHTSLDQ
jgi:hypothetical protein